MKIFPYHFQRRRWGPSTMANIVDLLGSGTLISKRNPSMSKPYMFYQLFSLACSILAPSTVILMIAGQACFWIDVIFLPNQKCLAGPQWK